MSHISVPESLPHSGEPLIIKKVVCMHEEDVGMAWKHVECASICYLSSLFCLR